MNRGCAISISPYGQDEWRLRPGSRLLWPAVGVSTPSSAAPQSDELLVAGQSTVFRRAESCSFRHPALKYCSVYWKGLMPRLGLAWDPTGSGKTSIRMAYGLYYDSFTNGVGGPLQAPLSALPWTQARQLSAPINFSNPWNGQYPFTANSFPQPTTVLTVENGMRPPYSQNWNFSIQRALAGDFLIDVRYIGNKGTHLPRMIEANPAIYGPGATSDNADQRRQYAYKGRRVLATSRP